MKQLWVVVESDERKSADLKSLSKRIFKSLAAKLSSLKRSSNHEFAGFADALSAAAESCRPGSLDMAKTQAADFEKTLPYH